MDGEELEQHFQTIIAVCMEMIDEATGDLYNDIAHAEKFLKQINRCTSQLREIQILRAAARDARALQDVLQNEQSKTSSVRVLPKKE